jgi:hypothetical protein
MWKLRWGFVPHSSLQATAAQCVQQQLPRYLPNEVLSLIAAFWNTQVLPKQWIFVYVDTWRIPRSNHRIETLCVYVLQTCSKCRNRMVCVVRAYRKPRTGASYKFGVGTDHYHLLALYVFEDLLFTNIPQYYYCFAQATEKHQQLLPYKRVKR